MMSTLVKKQGQETGTTHEMNVKLGDVFKIKIEGNMTTGFSWVLASLSSSFYLLDVTYLTHEHPPGMVGVGGTHIFTFKAIKNSTTEETIVFKQMRPWMSTAINTQTWNITIDNSVAYERYNDYFVNNTVAEGVKYLTLGSMSEFEKYFSAGAIMGPQHWITESSFDKNQVVAIILPEENVLHEIGVEELVVVGDTLEVRHHISKGTPISYSVRVPLVLLVEKGNYKEVAFIPSNGEQKNVTI